ncbi:MAG: ABC transporter permease [Balneolaceae bacterium]
MIKNYLKIAFRTIKGDKYFSLISFVGLTVGLSFFGLMLLFIAHEQSYDTMYSDSDRIYRTVLNTQRDGNLTKTAHLPLPFSEVIEGSNAGILANTKVFGVPQRVVETATMRGRMDEIVATDEQFFHIFDLNLIYGDIETALESQMSIVLTRETATRFFGDTNPVGESFDVQDYGLFTVTGVLDDIPKNSSFRFTALMHADIDRYLGTMTDRQWFIDYYTGWNGRVAYNYIKLEPGVEPVSLSSQITSQAAPYFTSENQETSIELQPVKDIHFGSADIQANLSELNGIPGNIQYLYIFAAIAILILTIACINYMNLASARSIKRTAEVGIRSVMGANKGQIITQFLVQSVLMALLSILPALGLLQFLIPYFELLTGIQLALSAENLVNVAIYAVPCVLIIGLVSGLYPSIMLLKYQLAETVKIKTATTTHGSFFRKGLVVGQFALTYSIIVITLIAGTQLRYIFDRDLGFVEEQVVVMEINDGRLRNFIPDMKQELLRNDNIIGMAGLTRMFSGYRNPQEIELNRENATDENLPLEFYGFDEDVVPVMGLEIIQGQNFLDDGSESLNTSSVLINETAAQMLFPGESPINKTITIAQPRTLEATVIGVVKDFHYQSLHVPIGPLVLGYIDNPIIGIDDFAVRISGEDIPTTIAYIEETIGKFIELDESAGLEYEFLNSMINQYYAADSTYHKLFTIGAWITIILSVIGLVGLTAFYAEMRTKEFGIRKVLGASVSDLVSLQSSFFLKLIGIAILIGLPCSLLISTQWLKNFSYQISLEASLFLIAGIFTALIALVPIAVIAYKTSLENPINSLKSE